MRLVANKTDPLAVQRKKIEPLAGERMENESDRAVQACNDFLRLGPGRSLPKLLKKFGKNRRNAEAPTDSYNTLERWSSDYGWPKRATLYDATQEEMKNEKRRQVMEAGLALDYERVVELKRLALFLKAQMFEKLPISDSAADSAGVATRVGDEYYKIWLADVKQIGAGEDSERVDLMRFNASIIDTYLKTLDDLAKETGGRRQRTEHILNNVDYSKLTTSQLERIGMGEDPIKVILSAYSTDQGED